MKTAASFKAQGKEVFNYVTGWSASKYHGSAIMTSDGKNIGMDDSRPITRERMSALHARISEMIGETLGTIKLHLSAFEPGDFDGANPQLWTKTYIYNPKNNSMVIWEDGEPVYSNDNGTICKDREALWDSLD